MTQPQPPQQPAPGVTAQMGFVPGPAQMRVEKVEVGGIPQIFILMMTPQGALGTYWSLDDARGLADTIVEKSGPGLSIVRGDAMPPGLTL